LLDDVDRGAANPWGIAATADGKWIFVTHAGTHELSLIDTTGLLKKVRKLGVYPKELTRDTAGISTDAVSSPAANVPNDLAFLVDLRRRIKLEGSGPHGVAIIGSKAYIAEYYSDTIAVVDTQFDTPKLAGRIRLNDRPMLDVKRRGEMLFNDATISFQHWQSCTSCHPDGRMDGLNWDLPNDGLGNSKNTRSLVHAHASGPVMSLGVRESARAAVRAGISHILFAVRSEEDAQTNDEYLNSLKPVPSPRLIDGKLSPAAERGKRIFFDQKIGCAKCHPEPFYTDGKAHDVDSAGAMDGTAVEFNTPRLTELWRTAPYMHDGRYLTVKELITEGKHGATDGDLGRLSEKDIDNLAEFLLSL
jgi:hypothetical protein